MIKLSDINVSVYFDKSSTPYRPRTVVEACLELHEVVTVDPQHQHYQKLIESAKDKVNHALYRKLYGDLRDPIEEMYAIVMVKMPYGPELDEVKELKGRIDKIMRGET